jgi:hypothetical protein
MKNTTNNNDFCGELIQNNYKFVCAQWSTYLLKCYDDSLEGKMAADPLKNKKMLNKSTNIFTFLLKCCYCIILLCVRVLI